MIGRYLAVPTNVSPLHATIFRMPVGGGNRSAQPRARPTMGGVAGFGPGPIGTVTMVQGARGQDHVLEAESVTFEHKITIWDPKYCNQSHGMCSCTAPGNNAFCRQPPP